MTELLLFLMFCFAGRPFFVLLSKIFNQRINLVNYSHQGDSLTNGSFLKCGFLKKSKVEQRVPLWERFQCWEDRYFYIVRSWSSAHVPNSQVLLSQCEFGANNFVLNQSLRVTVTKLVILKTYHVLNAVIFLFLSLQMDYFSGWFPEFWINSATSAICCQH